MTQELHDALLIVLELARNGMLGDREADTPELRREMRRQMKAINKVERLIAASNKD